LHCTPLLAGNMRNFLQVQFPSAHDMDIICEWHIKYLMYLFMCLLVGLFVCCFFVVSLYTENGVHTMHYKFHVLHSTRLCCVTSFASYHDIMAYHSIMHSLHFVTCNRSY
jgi:hypothetical protein